MMSLLVMEDSFLHNSCVYESPQTITLPLSCFVPTLNANSAASLSNSVSSSVNNPVQSVLLISSSRPVHQASRTSIIEEFSCDDTDSSLLSSCRICQLSAEEANVGPLISPCRCAGTLKFVHHKCLAKWLEVRSWPSRKPPTCELCHYQFHRHKKLKLRCWRCPSISGYDKLLHMLFLMCVLIMSGCATAMVLCFAIDRGNVGRISGLLSSEEGVTLVCGVIFFIAFFIAAFVEVRVERSIYRLMCDLLTHNVDWTIDDYDRATDIGRSTAVCRTGIQECQTAV